jgi:two-component system response regulator
MNNNLPLEIILVEDNDQDAELTNRAMRQFNLGINIVRLTDGQEAIDYFFSENSKTTAIRRLILMYSKFPVFSGLQVLKRFKRLESTRCIPIVMLTSSTEENDIQACYHLGVNSYISKPVEFDSYQNMMRT